MVQKEFSSVRITLLDNKTRESNGKKSSDIHIHQDMQLLAGSSGILEVSVASKKINLRVGDVMLINSRTPHSVKPVLPFTATVVIQIPSEEFFSQKTNENNKHLALALQKKQKNFTFLRREDPSVTEIFDIITRMNEENTKKEKSYTLFTDGYMKILVGLLHRSNVFSDVSKTYNTDAITKLYPVLEHVEKNLSREISLEEAATLLDMNREYFCRLFKKSLGISFIDYTNFMRIHRAEDLLISTQQNISDISTELGFSSVSYFTRVFKSTTNITPSNYRNIKYFKTDLL